jgi:hypothetical protein
MHSGISILDDQQDRLHAELAALDIRAHDHQSYSSRK